MPVVWFNRRRRMARVAIIAGQAQTLVNFRGPLIEALLREGHTVVGIGPEARAETLHWLAERGVTYCTVPLARASLSPAGDLAALRELRSLLLREKPDVVLAYTIKPVVYGLLAARLAHVPRRYAMITGLGYAFIEGDRSLKRGVVRRIARSLYQASLRFANAVIFQNPDDLALFRAQRLLGPRVPTAIVAGSGVDVDRFQPAPLPAAPRFVLIARLVADKGIVEYVEAARAVRSAVAEAQFILVGPSDPNPAALPPGLVERAVADGIIDYQGELLDVRPAIAAASVFVLPSYREGTPRAVLEAMAMGRPIITTDAPGCRETVTDGVNGLLVSARSAEKLAEAMTWLAAAPQERARMGAESRRIAVEKYCARAVAAHMVEIMGLQRHERELAPVS